MAKREKYKITNTTIKPVRKCPETGRDLRKAIEIVGHAVSFRDERNNVIALHARDNPRIVNELTEGMYRLQQGGMIKIERIADVASALKDHTLKRNQKATYEDEPAKSRAEVSREQEAQSASESGDGVRRAKVSEMGSPTPTVNADTQQATPGAVNPDGAPNFVVTAPSRRTRNRGKEEPKNADGLALEADATGV